MDYSAVNIKYREKIEKLDPIAYERFQNGESLTKIAKDYNMNRCKLANRLKDKYGIIIKNDGGKLAVNSNYFQTWNRENAYWFGIILADGNISQDLRAFEITLKDKEHVERFKRDIQSEHKIGIKKVNGEEYYRISIKDKTFVNDLYKKGIVPNKSNTDFFLPEVPDEFFGDFLRGIIDGDGYYYYRSNNDSIHIHISCGFHCQIYATTLHKKIIDMYKVKVSIKPQRTCFDIVIYKRDTIRIINEIYKDTDLYLQRKYERIKPYLKGD